MSAIAALPLAVYSLANETVRLSVWKVMWLLAAITVATAGSAVIYGLRREVRHARQLGQYTLEEKLGEGGMGVVYRARHAMLRRPTAIKLLKPERMGEASLRRFEREVQLTAGSPTPTPSRSSTTAARPTASSTTRWSTSTGLDLDQLVAADGPQPPGRVVHILRQVLGALAEAHGVGLVHRDIKPGEHHPVRARRALRRREGRRLRPREGPRGGRRADPRRDLVGTPLYLAPEAIRSPGAPTRAPTSTPSAPWPTSC